MKKTYKTTDLLRQLNTDVEKLIEIAGEDLATLSGRELNWKPWPEQWSVAECLEHLNIYSRYYNPAMKEAIAEGKKYGSEVDTFKSGWLGNYSVQSVLPDNLKKQKTLKRLDPKSSKLDRTVVDDFLKYQEDLKEVLKASQSVNLNKIKIRVDVARFFKIKLGDCLRFVVAHEQRHIKQAQEVLKGMSPLIA